MPLEDKLPSQLLIGNIKVLQKKANSSLPHKSPLPFQKPPTYHGAHQAVEKKYRASHHFNFYKKQPTNIKQPNKTKQKHKTKKGGRKQGTKESWNCLEITTTDEALLGAL